MTKIKTENTLLTDYLKLGVFKKDFRQKVMDKCGWSKPTFHKKLKAPQSISDAEKEAIQKIMLVVIDQMASVKSALETV